MSYETIHLQRPPRHADPDRTGQAGTVLRLVRLLEAIGTHDEELGIRALARMTQVDKSAVSRLLQQLAEAGMLEPTGVAGRYRIGPRFFAIAAAVTSRDELWVAARPILERLVGQFDETCYLAVAEDDEVVFREKVECGQAIRYVVELGRPAPLHAGAAGRAILSGTDPGALDAFLQRTALAPLTEQTITDPVELRRLVDDDRARGYSVSLGERSIGGAGVAAPFFLADGRCGGSLVMTMPMVRVDRRRIPAYGEAMVAAAAELSTRLGLTTLRPAAGSRR